MTRRTRVVCGSAAPAILGLMFAAAPAAAQHRPLLTQDPEVIGQGRLLVEAGVETGTNIWYPVSGLTGDRTGLPLGVSIGIGPAAELQIDSGYQWLSIDRRDPAPLDFRVREGDSTSDVVDASLALKLRFLSEGGHRPAFALRFVTELPNAGNESGLGLDTLNFSASLLAGKTVGSLRVVGNAGVVLLSDVLQGSLQQDAFIGGVSVARAFTPAVDLVGEVTGRRVLFSDHPPIGAEPRAQARGAVRYTHGRWRADAGLIVGLTDQDPDIGFTVGLTWVAQAK